MSQEVVHQLFYVGSVPVGELLKAEGIAPEPQSTELVKGLTTGRAPSGRKVVGDIILIFSWSQTTFAYLKEWEERQKSTGNDPRTSTIYNTDASRNIARYQTLTRLTSLRAAQVDSASSEDYDVSEIKQRVIRMIGWCEDVVEEAAA